MIRIILFLIVLAGFALAAAWLAERPGDISITWMGWRIETSLMVATAALAVLFVIAMLVWSLLRLIWRSPRLLARSRRDRRRRRGERALSRGLVAVASGDMRGARKFASEAERFAGEESLALLLQAQTAQLAGDRSRADAAFRAMAEKPDTRVLGLRGLYVEAQRRGDAEAGRRHAEEVARIAPSLPWAGQAVLEFRCAAGDWAGALSALDANLRSGLIDRAIYRRHRAVLLTARALEREEKDAASAKAFALEAAKLAPDLEPTVALAAKLSAETGEGRRAARLIEAAWRTHPHPELADIYAYLRSGDSARDRLARARQLVRIRPEHRESALALARAALDAKEFAAARAALAPLSERPTQRVAMLMAELEESEHGDLGRAREWMARALRAGGDPRWVADNFVSDRWLPVSPVSGRIDAFEWKPPSEEFGAAGPLLESPAGAPQRDALAPAAPPADAAVEELPSAPEAAPATPTPATPPTATAKRPAAPTPIPARREPVIPLIHAPDDPGPDADARAAEGDPGRPAAGLRPPAG